jgi:hypothetical protein
VEDWCDSGKSLVKCMEKIKSFSPTEVIGLSFGGNGSIDYNQVKNFSPGESYFNFYKFKND